ncbi:MAG: amino acid ABC transporter substrate-binding protein [Clostridia bacterium]|nr:amino acid ABC transporter substrate-binding protein [Clostridia bacterium]
MSIHIKAVALIIGIAAALSPLASCGNTGKTDAAQNVAETVADASSTNESEEVASNTVTPPREFSVKDVDKICEAKLIRIGVTENAPMSYRDENGEWTGFDIEFAEAFANNMRVEAEFVEITPDNARAELDAGNIDCCFGGVAVTADVTEHADVSDAYAVNCEVLVASSEKENVYSDISAVDGSVAVCGASAGRDTVIAEGLPALEYPKPEDALLAVRSGTCAACVVDIKTAETMVGEGKAYGDLAVCSVLTDESYMIAFRKDSDLRIQVNDTILGFCITGVLPDLAEKYGVTLANRSFWKTDTTDDQ